MHTASGAPPRREAHSLPYNVGLLVLLAALFGVALAYWIDAAGRGTAHPAVAQGDGPVVRTLAGRELRIPASWFRDGGSRSAGFSKQIDLRLVLPLGVAGRPLPVAITLAPRSQVRPSSALLDGVYLHQFQPEQLSGPPGLVGKPLVAVDGYKGETVWYDPLSANPFVAKCLAPVAGEKASRCLRSVYLGTGIAAVYDFDAEILANWRQFDAELAGPLGRIGAL
ncbi:MAG TPA: hypothetical protein VG757_17145 [Devosia sp.]|nr:hypothetical protein [Devosia sp.]